MREPIDGSTSPWHDETERSRDLLVEQGRVADKVVNRDRRRSFMPVHRYLLLQVRNPDDPMRSQERNCFAKQLNCQTDQIEIHDLLAGVPQPSVVAHADALFFGGSGDYSAAAVGDEWLELTLEGLRQLVDTRKPIFASCWGFQAMARALGGRCIHDPRHAEIGTIELRLTAEGKNDPLFSALPDPFAGQAGHMDHVVELPPNAVLLASSAQVTNQAFKVADCPIYCTQFHPELDRHSLLERLESYPEYVRKISGETLADFSRKSCHETPAANSLLANFVKQFVA